MIDVDGLTKVYKTPLKKKGFGGFFENLFNRQYKKVMGLDNISFNIAEGELVGLIGPNGAGKTTTMKILAGILYPTSGDVKVLGYTPFEKNPEFLRQIAFVMGQKNQLLWDLPPTDTFTLNKEIYGVSDGEFKKTVDYLTELLNCKDLLTHQVRTMSLGERMKMELIAALIHRPKILFLDEPTIGLDVVAQKTIRDFIKVYQKENKATIILTSHYMEDVKQLAKRVMVINTGKIIFDGELDKLVKKYVKEKLITVILEDKVDEKKLASISKNYDLQFPRVTFRVSRENLTKKVEEISTHLDFADINIEEERIEDVIRKFFQTKR